MLRALIPVLLIVLAAPALAQDEADWRFGGDAYLAGRTVTLSGDSVEDLFAAGDKVTSRAEVGGSAHMAGRYVTLMNRVGENFYGAGMEVDIDAPVAGNVTIMGQRLTVTEPISGNLRATGSRIRIEAPVAGNAILAGETVSLTAAIMGDLALATEESIHLQGDHRAVSGGAGLIGSLRLAQQVIQCGSGQEVIAQVGQAFIARDLGLLLPPRLRETLQVENV